MESLNTPEGVIALAAAGLAVVAIALATTALMRLRKLRAAQKAVLGEAGEADLIGHAVGTTRRVDDLQSGIDEVSGVLFSKIEEIDAALGNSVAHTAVVRYDAFKENSGRQSSSVAVLDRHGDGLIISAILQRDQARVYAKAVVGGRSELELSPEERQAVEEAMARGVATAGGRG
ncbi:MAG: DUF4446 family protein [Solirubrobacterales bacterium]